MAESNAQHERTYPIGLRVDRRRCLVVGGGNVAERKVAGLLDCGADVHAVSPTFTDALAANEAITRHGGEYAPALLDGAVLVIAATDDAEVNRRVAADARGRGIPVNVVDTPALCDFYCPAVVRRGPLAIAIHSGGAAPALLKTLRRRLEQEFGPEYAALFEALGRVRLQVLDTVDDPPTRSLMLRRLGDGQAVSIFFERGFDALMQYVREQT